MRVELFISIMFDPTRSCARNGIWGWEDTGEERERAGFEYFK